MTRERRHIFTNFPGGGPPDPPVRGCTLIYLHLATSWHGSAVFCRWLPAPPTHLRSPPTLKVADNPDLETNKKHNYPSVRSMCGKMCCMSLLVCTCVCLAVATDPFDV